MYELNESKAFISIAGSAAVLLVMAHTGGPGFTGFSAFVVPADTLGVIYRRKEQKMGWNSQSTRGIMFEKAQVPASHLLGRERDGFKIPMKGLDGGRINIATCFVGAAQGVLNAVQRYARQPQF